MLWAETVFHEDHVCLFDADACGVKPPINLAANSALARLLVTPRVDLSGVASLGNHEFTVKMPRGVAKNRHRDGKAQKQRQAAK